MENIYTQPEEILENPGLFLFRIDNKNNTIVEGKQRFSKGDINCIKNNITRVFTTISEEIENFKGVSPEYFEHIIKNLNAGYNDKKKFNFPGLQVINMDREKLNYFTHYPDRFLLCEKSDGVRYLLVQYRNGKCHLIGRNLEFFEIEYSGKLPPAYQNQVSYSNWGIDYLLDGELVLDDVDEKNDDERKFMKIKINEKYKKINFIIFDAVVIKGTNFGFLPFKRRLEEFSRVFLGEYEIQQYIKNRGVVFIDKYKSEMKKKWFYKNW